eukprot:gene12054-5550_t
MSWTTENVKEKLLDDLKKKGKIYNHLEKDDSKWVLKDLSNNGGFKKFLSGKFEREYLILNEDFYPRASPNIYFYDTENFYICMEYLDQFTNLKEELIFGRKNKHLLHVLGQYIATKSFKTSNLSKKSSEVHEMLSKFTGNHVTRDFIDYLNFKRGYCPKETTDLSQVVQEKLKEIQNSKTVKMNVARLKTEMKENIQCVCHGDFHTGSVLMKDERVCIVDSECATVGPIAYDIGIFFGNLLVAYLFQNFFDKERSEYKKWIFEVINEIWNIFAVKFISLWNEVIDESFWSCEEDFKEHQKEYISKILQSTIGYMGIIIMRSVINKWPEYQHVKEEQHDKVAVNILSTTALILNGGFENISDVLKSIEKLDV